MTLNYYRIKDTPVLTDIGFCSNELSFGFLGRQIDCRLTGVEFISDDLHKHTVSFLEQVHGNGIIDVSTHSSLHNPVCQGDGWIVDRSKIKSFAVGIKTADCFPLVMVSSDRRLMSLLHCGWRSVSGKIVPRAISIFNGRGVRSSDIQAYIGPGAQECCYEVGDDLASLFCESMQSLNREVSEKMVPIIRSMDKAKYLSIPRYLKAEMQSFGLLSKNIFDSNQCTICNNQYFSYRREKNLAGRQLSFICGFEPIEIIGAGCR